MSRNEIGGKLDKSPTQLQSKWQPLIKAGLIEIVDAEPSARGPKTQKLAITTVGEEFISDRPSTVARPRKSPAEQDNIFGEVLEAVQVLYGVGIKDLTSITNAPSRTREIRNAAAWVAYQRGVTNETIATMFGLVRPSTARYTQRSVGQSLDDGDVEIVALVGEIQGALSSGETTPN